MSSCPFAAAFSTYKGKAEEIMATLPEVLDEKTLEVVNATAAVVAGNIETITTTFYPHMFETHPVTRNYFNPAHQVVTNGETKAAQPFALAHAIVRYVGHLQNPEALRKAIELAAQKHCALSIRAEHYPIVYESFMWAVAKILGDALTPEIATAWGKVVLFIARAFIQRELEIYETELKKDNGWFGFKEFKVTGKKRCADNIYSYTLTPADGSKLPISEAGQYITLKLHIPGASAETSLRNYSVVSPPGSPSYTICVQVEPGLDAPPGLVSNYLRDHVEVGATVEVGMPFGTFKLKPTEDKPVVLIAGGIGCTVTMSMLSHVTKDREFNKLYFVHSSRDGSSHAYRNKVARLQAEHKDKVKVFQFYSKPRPSDKKGVDYDVEGRINVAQLEGFLGDDLKNANYVLCGPEGLVIDVIKGLLEKEVPQSAIQFECFGPLATGLEPFCPH